MLCFVLCRFALHCFALLCTDLHCFALLCHALHCFAMPCIALHCFALLCIALHCFALLCFALLCCSAGPLRWAAPLGCPVGCSAWLLRWAAPLGCSAGPLRWTAPLLPRGVAPRLPPPSGISGSVARCVLASRCGLARFLEKVCLFQVFMPGRHGNHLLAVVLQWSFLGKCTPLQPQQQFSVNFVLV